MKFYETVLGMKVLRHEEFSEGCEATCNGPYGGAWSKTVSLDEADAVIMSRSARLTPVLILHLGNLNTDDWIWL